MSGTKHDTGKAPWHLLAWDAVRLVVLVLEFGAKKYAERNWEKGIVFSRCFAAAQRHMVAWWDREDLDPETQLNHLAHAICELMFALAFVLRGRTDLDDRPVTVAVPVPVPAPTAKLAVCTDTRCVFCGNVIGGPGHVGPCVWPTIAWSEAPPAPTPAPAPASCAHTLEHTRGARCHICGAP